MGIRIKDSLLKKDLKRTHFIQLICRGKYMLNMYYTNTSEYKDRWADDLPQALLHFKT